MHIVEVTVSAGQTYSHPADRARMFRTTISLKAVIVPGDDYETSVRQLQARAEDLVNDHVWDMRQNLRKDGTAESEREGKN